MSRTHVRRRRTLAILAMAAVILPVARAAAAGAAETREPRPIERYVVRPGDTLWGIAESHDVANDPRDGVQILLQLNPEAASLQPGMGLKLPSS